MATSLGASDLKLDFLVGGLDDPLYLTHAGDGSGRLFILERPGRIRVFDGQNLLPNPFLDITARVNSGGEKGLLGLAFHPNFATNRRFFVNYTRSQGGLQTVIAEYQASAGNPNVSNTGEQILVSYGQPREHHNGGWIGFGPDGFLYIATGDGGGGGDPFLNGQNINTLLGAILRIDVDSETGIPSDNPFVGQAGADEIWAYGLRNPWRGSFDRGTGRLILGDVGQDRFEEVDIIQRGGNYGWNIVEGDSCFSPQNGCNTSGLIPPIVTYGRGEGASITGGYVYRGPEVTEHVGDYIFGDFISGSIWSLREVSPGTWQRTLELGAGPFSVASFGEDEAGNLYVVNLSGIVSSLHFGNPPPNADLSIGKQVQSPLVTVGEIVSYSLTVRNNGPDPATAVRVEDQLPPTLQFEDFTASGAFCSAASNGLTCDLGTMAPNQTIQIGFNARIENSGQISNTASVSSTTDDPNSGNNSGSISFAAETAPTDLRISKIVDGSEPIRDSIITFRLDISNQGPARATNIRVVDSLPAGMTLESFSSPTLDCGAQSQTVICTGSGLDAAAVALVTIGARVNTIGNQRNEATVTFEGEELNPEDNSSGVDITVLAPADLVLEMSLRSGLFPGKKGEYLIRVTNQGEVASSSPITITDDLQPPLSFYAVEASEWTCLAEANLVSCSRATPIEPAAASEIYLQVLVGQGLGEVSNTATVTLAEDADIANNAATVVESLLTLEELPLTYSQLALGGGLDLTLLVSNRGSTAWAGEAQLREGNDLPWSSPWTLNSVDQSESAEFQLDLAPFSTTRFLLAGGDTARSGFLRFAPAAESSSLDLVISFFYQLSRQGVLEDSTATPLSHPGRVFEFPVERREGISNTGIAWAPLQSTDPFPLQLTLFDAEGQLVTTESVDFDGHEGLLLPEIFAEIPSDFLGLLILESPELIHLTVLRLDLGSTLQLTSIQPRIEPH